jgi:holo-[acyl-carrier protein] synthase
MIFGIGSDVIETARIRAAFERHGERFVERILGPIELAVHRRRAQRSPQRGLAYLATRFAAKEAISKALGLGMRSPMTWRAVQIVNAGSGKPEAVASGELAQFIEQRGLRLHVSVSDLENLAIAHAVAETVEREGAGR